MHSISFNPVANQISTKQAAELIQVHESSIKRWCNDGELQFTLTEGRHRRLALENLIEFARGRGIEVPLAWFRGFEADVWFSTSAALTGDYSSVMSLIGSWIKSNRIGYVYRLVEYLNDQGVEWAAICDHVLAPIMTLGAEEWKSGCGTRVDEHYNAEIVNDILQFRRHSHRHLGGNVRPSSRIAVLGCPGSEFHELGLMMVRVILEELGWSVIYLGSNVPVIDLADAQRKYSAEMVCISISSAQTFAGYSRAAEVLASCYSDERPYVLAMGGPEANQGTDELSYTDTFKELLMFSDIQTFASWIGQKESQGAHRVIG
ncbi:MAG: excisionase family DNA-binding protein [Rhodothermales bacterium]|nr:excisionase family DNA-binding protein [Rhodothermales bacterium]